MKLYLLENRQTLPISIEEAWDYFSDASKLPEITPPSMHFEVTWPLPKRMYSGMIASYRLTPLFGIPVQWVTEITHVQDFRFFVDEQRFGPYRFWHHQHHFKEIEDGIEMTDMVHYALPFDPVVRIVHSLAVRKQLQHIFQFRRDKLEMLFGKTSTGYSKEGEL